jgi:hypothetical protein
VNAGVGPHSKSIEWLLESEPAIRWQAMRDLTDAPAAAIAEERARVAREGLGAEILAQQKEDGAWRRGDGKVWLSTLFTMLLLRTTGVEPADAPVKAAMARAEAGLRWSDKQFWELRGPESGGNGFFEGEEEPCINGGVLAYGAYFGHPSEKLARRLLSEQLADGGWNCNVPKSKVSSFHTTICVLEGLLEYERALRTAPEIAVEIAAARGRGEEYLLKRSLFRRLSTGEAVDPAFLENAFPPRYHYDVLRALDYFRAAGARPDTRMDEAVRFIESKRQDDGRWRLDRAYDEVVVISGQHVGQPSRWNTLRALRVLRWYRANQKA